MVWESILPLVAGLVLLVGGAEFLVRGASRLAANVGISPLVIGLTVVAYGTSAPELAVSLGAALSGQGDVAVGNVIGSNTFNVLFILGVSALIVPLLVHQQLVRAYITEPDEGAGEIDSLSGCAAACRPSLQPPIVGGGGKRIALTLLSGAVRHPIVFSHPHAIFCLFGTSERLH